MGLSWAARNLRLASLKVDSFGEGFARGVRHPHGSRGHGVRTALSGVAGRSADKARLCAWRCACSLRAIALTLGDKVTDSSVVGDSAASLFSSGMIGCLVLDVSCCTRGLPVTLVVPFGSYPTNSLEGSSLGNSLRCWVLLIGPGGAASMGLDVHAIIISLVGAIREPLVSSV